ncbi:hypothetical protein Q8G42_13800 [Acinetobacter lwoffii]|uniref:Uncharacterized protein n=2 Tax=Acinetobacter lwoffii TaxID=28090 RepID=A0AAW8AZD7_ACILW|nr:hypothetical protein [Acinetobacter lwoffii]MDP1371776.1 hypothetical protein [Acinetobacter lwoffii]MDP1391203.1 hypothetical protein [Acinetobacter lwoffii]MDP1448881.1 hypothetical protein [Acinetobacter lwoffii]
MAEQNNNEVMIQLPWTVPQQPNIQTIVLQQPAKTHMELNASTDKTAISSFALSVVIALIFGALATWLAYWDGRKSFELTKQGFNLTLEQIGKSVEQTLNSNRELYQSQKDLQLMQIKSTHRQDWINNIRELFSEILIVRTKMNIVIANDFSVQSKEALIDYLVEFRKLTHKVTLYLNPLEESSEIILSDMRKIDSLVTKCFNKDIIDNELDELSKILISKTLVQNIQKLLKKEWERVKKGE